MSVPNDDLQELINIYNRSILQFSQQGTHITSRDIKKNGLHLICLAEELYVLENKKNRGNIKNE